MPDPHKRSSPDVAVGISVYRQSLGWIQQAIRSVQAQCWQRWSLCLRLDGPDALTPDDAAALDAWIAADPRIRLVHGRQRLGCFGSYREIFKSCSAAFLLQLDADDWLAPSALSQTVAALAAQPNAPFVYTQARHISHDGRELGLDIRALRRWQRNQDLVQFTTFHLRLVRQTAYQAVGGYDGSYSHAGDHDLCLRLAELGDPIHLAEPLYFYRLHAGSASQQQRRHTHLESVQAARQALRRRGLAETHRLIQHPVQEIVTLEPRRPGPFLIAGLHRSGTSLLARALIRLGLDLGDQFPTADPDNPEGYQEDRTFQALHRHWFQEEFSDAAGGWPDWGWTNTHAVSCLGRASWRAEARLAISSRCSSRPWGWKDPRTTLLLPFWQNLLGSIKVVGIVRAPWDISDAFCRLQADVFRCNPTMILPLWRLYNQRLLDFAEAHPEHTLLLQAERFTAEPDRLTALLRERWDQSCPDLNGSDLVDPKRLSTLPPDDPLAGLFQRAYPDWVDLWLQLVNRADNADVARLPTVEARWNPPQQPRLSVIIATRNPCHWLLEAVASVMRHQQQPGDVELLIVDDGSDQPDALHILHRLKEHGLPVLHRPPRGLAAARNAGMRAAKADLLLPLDDDNRLLRPYLNNALQLLEHHPSVSLLYGDRIEFGVGATRRRIRPGPLDRNQLLQRNPIDACAIFRRSLWQRCGGYDEKLTALEDWDLWLTAAKGELKACYLPEPCFEYRIRENSMLRKHLNNPDQQKLTMTYLQEKHGIQKLLFENNTVPQTH